MIYLMRKVSISLMLKKVKMMWNASATIRVMSMSSHLTMYYSNSLKRQDTFILTMVH